MQDQQARSRLVLIDELSLVRESVAELCEATGKYAVAGQSGDAIEGFELIESSEPDVAIIDFNVPRLFSLELVRKIQMLPQQTLTVILSVRGDRKLVLECLRAGVNAFVLKSGPSRNLLDALEQIMTGGIYVSPELQLDKIFAAPRAEAADPLETLSSREYQVFSLLVDGVRAKEIAARLDLSPKTVDTYRASLMRKLDIHDVAGLVKFAIHRELTNAG
ncbi:MAG TPA: response regulator transcription factor [Bryobacteraceae bacterium]|nr:response regulator transcription factor [Bryobacteraceae bacterium]